MKVVFCGTGHFQDGYLLTKQELSHDEDVDVVECDRDELSTAIVDAHVIIPLMSRITAGSLLPTAIIRLYS
jgi:hypothetical protein